MEGNQVHPERELLAPAVKGSISVGIITIRDDEFEAVLDQFPERQRISGRKRFYECARVRTKTGSELRIAIGRSPEQGHGAAQALATDLIDELAPRWILLVGIAGGLPDTEFSLGDVILSSRVHDFSVSAALSGGHLEFQQQGGPVHTDVEKLLTHLPAMRSDLVGWNTNEKLGGPRPKEMLPQKPDERYYGEDDWQKKTHSALEAHFGISAPDRSPIFKVFPTITSNTLVKDDGLARQWKNSARHAAAVEMELGGVNLAARYAGSNEPRVLAVRGISDIVGYKRSAQWTAFACRTAASFAASLIEAGLLEGAEIVQRPQPSTQPAHVVPLIGLPPRIALFTGRSAEIESISAAFAQGTPAAVTSMQRPEGAATHGIGGVGKSSLAAEFCYRYQDQFGGVSWCPAETRVSLVTSLSKLGRILGAALVASDLEDAARNTLHSLAQQQIPWLLVYDNVQKPDDILDLLPTAGTRLIVTSRFFDWITWASEIPVDVLSFSDSVSFLNSRAGRVDVGGAELLARALGGLPLALDQAAASCRRTQIGFAEFARKVTSIAQAQPVTDLDTGIKATFEIALIAAIEKCPEAAMLMAYLAQCAPERIPIELIEGALEDSTKQDRAIAVLSDASLIRLDPFENGQQAITVHRVVQAIARAQTSVLGSESRAVERLIIKLAALFPTDGYDQSTSWDRCSRLTPHVLFQFSADASRTREIPEWSALLSSTASYLQARSSLSEAASLFKEALNIRERTLRRHYLTGRSHGNYGNVLAELGDKVGARYHAEQAVEIHEETLSSDDPALAVTLINLAAAVQHDDPSRARALFARALEIREKALGPDHMLTANSLRHLAQLLVRLNDTAAARPLITHAVMIADKNPPSLYGGMIWAAMATTLRIEGDLTAAKTYNKRAIVIWEKDHPNHVVTNGFRATQAELCLEAGNASEALTFADEAFSAFERVVGLQHPSTRKAATILIKTFEALGRVSEAKAVKDRCGF